MTVTTRPEVPFDHISAFAKWEKQAWPYGFKATIAVKSLAGGIPSDPKVAEGWLKTKLESKDAVLERQVEEVMAERNISRDAAVEQVNSNRYLTGFKKDKDKGLYVEGRQLKACIKEAAMVALAAGKLPDRWGTTKKGTFGFVAEHIQVEEDRIYLGVMEPSRVDQSFPKNPRTQQTGLQYLEVVEGAAFTATITSDHNFSKEQWAMIMLTAEKLGFGASRSQGYGKFKVITFESIGA